MPINASIPLQVQPLQLENPLNQLSNFYKVREQQQAAELNALKAQATRSELANQNALSQYVASADLSNPDTQQNLLKYGTAGAAMSKSLGDTQQSQAKVLTDRMAALRSQLNTVTDPQSYINWIHASHADPVVGQWLDSHGLTEQQSIAQAQQAMQQPGGFQNLLVQSAAGVEKAIEMNKPTLTSQDLGDRTRIVRTNPYGGPAEVVPGSEAKKGEKPGAGGVDAALSPAAVDFIASQVLLGNKDAGAGFARNKIAKAQIANRMADLAVTMGIDPKEANLRTAEFFGTKAEQRTFGTQSANVQVAANEADKMITTARNFATKVDVTRYPSINAIKNAVSKGTGGPEIVALNTALNSLINAYARAINPKGVPTDSDKAHAREILNANLASGQLDAAFDVMHTEMQNAIAAPAEIKASRHEKKGSPKTVDWSELP